MKGTSMDQLTKKPLFNPQGDTSLNARRMIGGNTTNLNDFNNMRYAWDRIRRIIRSWPLRNGPPMIRF